MNTRDAALAKIRELAHFIGGKHVSGESGRFGDVFNPTRGALAARVPLASKLEVERAIANAKEAFAGWSETSPLARARVMFRFKELIERHMDELALLIASEHGKVLSDAKGSIQHLVGALRPGVRDASAPCEAILERARLAVQGAISASPSERPTRLGA